MKRINMRKKLVLISILLTLSICLTMSSSVIQVREAVSQSASRETKQSLLDENLKYEPDVPTKDHIENDYSDAIHSVFRENRGQVSKHLDFYASLPQGMVGFGCSTVFFMISGSEFQLSFIDANPITPRGVGILKGYSNYLIGDQAISNIRHYSYVVYDNLYEGITLRYKLGVTGLKYEFEVSPFADITQIKLEYSGLDAITIKPSIVELTISDLTVADDNLEVWYSDTGERIGCFFQNNLDGSTSSPIIQFSLAPTYDPSRPIIIDPEILIYSTYLGSSGEDRCFDPVLDDSDNIYVAGWSTSSDLPITSNAFDTSLDGDYDAFVVKLSADGSELLFSTFLGGSADDWPFALGLDSFNNIWVAGDTFSADFPTLNAYNSTYSGLTDVFLVQLAANGSTLLYSTFLGGSKDDSPTQLRIDESDNVYILGGTSSPDFPTVNAYDSTYNGGTEEKLQMSIARGYNLGDIFISKFSSNGSILLYSTFFGDINDDYASNMVLDSKGNVYFTGSTWSSNFPVTLNAYSSTHRGVGDVYITKLAANGSTLLYSTLIGGKQLDYAYGIALDSVNNVYITGSTASSDYPTTPNVFDPTHNGRWDIFSTKLSVDGSNLLYSTFIGTDDDEKGGACVLDSSDNVYLVGGVWSSDFNVTGNAYSKSLKGDFDQFILLLSKDGSSLLYSSYFGGNGKEYFYGVDLNSNGYLCATGFTTSTDFPVTTDALQKDRKGESITSDVFICILNIPKVIPSSSIPTMTSSTSSSTDGGAASIELEAVVTALFGLCLYVRRRKK